MARKPRTNGNFLATDKVPESIFGIPVVASPEQYTDEDIQFFEKFPDAGGYYDLGGQQDGEYQQDEEYQQDALGGNAGDTFTWGAVSYGGANRDEDRERWAAAANKLIAQYEADSARSAVERDGRDRVFKERREAAEARTAEHEASANVNADLASYYGRLAAKHTDNYQTKKENEANAPKQGVAPVKTPKTAARDPQPAPAPVVRSAGEAGAPAGRPPKAADSVSPMRRLILAAGEGNLDMDEAGYYLDSLHKSGDKAGSTFLSRAFKNSGYEIRQIPITKRTTRNVMVKPGGWGPSADGRIDTLELGDRSWIRRDTAWLPFWADSPDIKRDDPAWVDQNADRIIETDAFLRSKGGGPHDTSAYYTYSFPELFGYSAAKYDPLGAVKSFFGMNNGKRTPVHSEGDVYYANAPAYRQIGVRHKVSRPTDAQKAARRKRQDKAADIVRQYMEYSGPRKANIPVQRRSDGSWYPTSRANDLHQDLNGGKALPWASDEDIDAAAEFITRKGHEGFKSKAYQPKLGRNADGTPRLGNWTVGHGHEFLADGTRVTKGTTMTAEDSMALVKTKLRNYAGRVGKEPWASKVTDAGAKRAILDLGYMRPEFYNEGMATRMTAAEDPNFEVHDTYSRYFNGPAGIRNRRLDGLREFFGDTITKYTKGKDGKYTRFFRGRLVKPKTK